MGLSMDSSGFYMFRQMSLKMNYTNDSWKGSLKIVIQFSSIQLLSHVRLFATPWTAAC